MMGTVVAVSEIKFRMWSRDYQQMFEMKHLSAMYTVGAKLAKQYVPGVAESDVTMPETGISLPFQDDAILMQYTGLKDKNGVEIYEGDIILLKHETGYNMWDESREVVTFYNGSFSCNIYAAPDDNICECEVIGNIYENPDLLGCASNGR